MDDTSAARTKHEGMWQRFTGKAKSMWGDLTDDDMKKFEGKYDEAMGYLKQRYGEKSEDLIHWWNEETNDEPRNA